MTIWLERAEDLAGLAAEWDHEVQAAGGDNPFLQSDFLLEWIAAFVPAGALRVLTVRDGSRLVGGLPLYAARRRGLPVLRAIGIGFAGLCEPWSQLPEREFARICAQALAARKDWRYLNLPLSRSAWLAPAEAVRTQVGTPISAARVRLQGESFEEYLAGRGPGLRKKMERAYRRAEAAGGVRLTTCGSGEELEAMIAFQMEHNGPERHAADGVVTGSRARWREFTVALLRRWWQRGGLEGWELQVGGEAAAVGFGVRSGRGCNYLLTSCDRRRARLSPGHLLFGELVRGCCERGEAYLDAFGVGESLGERERGLRAWCNEFPPLYQQRIFRADAAGTALGGMMRLWSR